MMAAGKADGRATVAGSTARVYAAIPVTRDFGAMVEAERFVPLPDDWTLGIADVVTSTEAVAAGRYREVNMAGAAVISAVSNAFGSLNFPFVFTGDGASFAVGPDGADRACRALAQTVEWARSDLGLALRAGAVGVGAVRAAGADLRVARHAASDDVDYAMFTGGGRDWAESELKAGRLTLDPAEAGARPDLTGLSCRFRDIPAANGTVLSVIVKPLPGADADGYAAAVRDVLEQVQRQPRAGHPVPVDGPHHTWPPQGFELEARARRAPGRPLAVSRLSLAARTLMASFVFWLDRPLGRFTPSTYRRELVANSDFRKFDDGLMMTVDCSEEAAAAIEARLAEAETSGWLRFGLHRQSTALVTCIVPSAQRPDHVHFVDGAAGGYGAAARHIKSKAG